MHYDPIKNIFVGVIRRFPVLRIGFYKLLDMMFLRSWHARRELKELRKLFGSKEISIYDAGTGYGQYSYFMIKTLQPNNIYAVDIKEDWIEDCKGFFSQFGSKISFAVEDLTQINHKDRFDLIVCVDVMEHIDDDVKVFRNFYNALKKDGFMIMNSPSLFGGSDVHGEEDESFIGEHARDGYSYEDLKSKLEPIGFTIHKCRYTYGFLGDKAWRLGIKYPMVALNFSKLLLFLLPFYYIVTLPFTLLMMYIDFKKNNKIGTGIYLIARK